MIWRSPVRASRQIGRASLDPVVCGAADVAMPDIAFHARDHHGVVAVPVGPGSAMREAANPKREFLVPQTARREHAFEVLLLADLLEQPALADAVHRHPSVEVFDGHRARVRDDCDKAMTSADDSCAPAFAGRRPMALTPLRRSRDHEALPGLEVPASSPLAVTTGMIASVRRSSGSLLIAARPARISSLFLMATPSVRHRFLRSRMISNSAAGIVNVSRTTFFLRRLAFEVSGVSSVVAAASLACFGRDAAALRTAGRCVAGVFFRDFETVLRDFVATVPSQSLGTSGRAV